MDRHPQHYRGGELVIVLDCADLARAAAFWSAVLGYTGDQPTSGPYQRLFPADGQGIEVLLQQVPETKTPSTKTPAKNRLHLDLRTPDLAAEVSRVTALGATVLTREPVTEDDWSWHVLADPDGNEFCILQPPA